MNFDKYTHLSSQIKILNIIIAESTLLYQSGGVFLNVHK